MRYHRRIVGKVTMTYKFLDPLSQKLNLISIFFIFKESIAKRMGRNPIHETVFNGLLWFRSSFTINEDRCHKSLFGHLIFRCLNHIRQTKRLKSNKLNECPVLFLLSLSRDFCEISLDIVGASRLVRPT